MIAVYNRNKECFVFILFLSKNSFTLLKKYDRIERRIIIAAEHIIPYEKRCYDEKRLAWFLRRNICRYNTFRHNGTVSYIVHHVEPNTQNVLNTEVFYENEGG